MNFDNIFLYDLITGFHRFILSFLILLFSLWPYSLYCVIQSMRELKIHSVETEVSQKSNVKVVTYVKRKTWSKGKANYKKERVKIKPFERATEAIIKFWKIRNSCKRMDFSAVQVETDTDISWKGYRRRSKVNVKTFCNKLIKVIKIRCAEAFLLGTFITHTNPFHHKLIQFKLKS